MPLTKTKRSSVASNVELNTVCPCVAENDCAPENNGPSMVPRSAPGAPFMSDAGTIVVHPVVVSAYVPTRYCRLDEVSRRISNGAISFPELSNKTDINSPSV